MFESCAGLMGLGSLVSGSLKSNPAIDSLVHRCHQGFPLVEFGGRTMSTFFFKLFFIAFYPTVVSEGRNVAAGVPKRPVRPVAESFWGRLSFQQTCWKINEGKALNSKKLFILPAR